MKDFRFEIEDNIDFKSTQDLISLYKTALETGEIYSKIIIIIKPIDDDLNGEVDPVFLSYLFLYLSDFKTKIEFKFSKRVKEGRFFSFKHIINYFAYLTPDLRIILKGEYYRKKDNEIVKVTYSYYNRKVNDTNLIHPSNLSIVKKFSPPIFIDSKDSIDEYFDKTKIAKNKLQHKFFEFKKNIESKLKLDESEDLSIFELYILRLLIQDEKNITTDIYLKDIEYVKELNRGLKELAENIVEHSKKMNGDVQQGIITARIYDKNRLKLLKSNDSKGYFDSFIKNEFFLDINIIDSGSKSIREMYLENILRNKKELNNKEYLDINFNNEYSTISNQSFNFFYEININELSQHQTNKIISRYGLQYFTHILKERFNAFIKVTSNEEKLKLYQGIIKDQKGSAESYNFGTSYNCIVPLERFVSLLEIDEITQMQKGEEVPSEINTYLTIRDYEIKKYDEKISNYKPKTIIKLDSEFIKINENDFNDKRIYITNIADVFLEIPENLRNNIFCVDSENINLSSSQWIRLLSVLTIYFKNLIVYNIPNETVSEIIKIRSSNYVEKNKVFKFWTNKSCLVFYSYKNLKSENYRRYGATALIGETPNQYNFINKQIWKHRYSYKNIFAIQGNSLYPPEKTSTIKSALLFDDNFNLKFFELILQTTIENRDLTLFEHSVQYSLNKNLIDHISKSDTNNKGYKIPDAHFKLGSKIHINDYYYAKRMFQNSFFTTPISFLIASDIFSKNKKLKDLTLVGYDSYSEILLTTIRYFLEKFFKEEKLNIKINHSTFVNNQFTRNLKSLSQNLIVIVPVASTLFTSIKMYQNIIEIQKNNNSYINNKFEFIPPFYNVVLVVDNNYAKNLKDSKHYLRDKFKWEPTKDEREICIQIYNSTEKLKQRYLIPVFTTWELPNECKNCYPHNFVDEKVLNSSREIPITPNISFGFPFVYGDNKKNTILNLNNSILYGNIKSGHNKFLYYLKISSLINENKPEIYNFLDNLKRKYSSKFEDKKIVIVTPASKTKSIFINLLNEKVFNFTANCITISIDEDFINNSRSLYEDAIFGADYIIYVDDVLATGKSYFKISRLVSFIRNNFKKNGIDYIITIINRLNFETELSIRNLFSTNEESLLYISRLHNPIIEEPNNDFPLDMERNRYANLSDNSSLDTICKIYKEKSDNLIEIDVLEKEKKNSIQPKYIQLQINDAIYSLFKYEVNGNTYINQELINKIFKEKNLGELIKYIEKYIGTKGDLNNNLKFVVIKLLTRPPLVYYKDIKETVFKWVLTELDNYSKIASSLTSPNEFFDFFNNKKYEKYSDYKTFLFLLKRSVQLESNAIFHDTILNRVKVFINSVYDLQSIEKFSNTFKTELGNLISSIRFDNNKNEINNLIQLIKEEGLFITNQEIFKDIILSNEINFDDSYLKENKQIKELSELYSNWKIFKREINIKTFIYKYVGYVNELIFSHDSKALKLKDNLAKYDSKPDFRNGNFNHLIRMLKLENTASIDKYWNSSKKDFFNLSESEINITNLCDKINKQIKKECEDPKLTNIQDLVCFNEQTIQDLTTNSSFINYLAIKTAINKWRIESDENSNNIESQIELILQATSNIIGLKGDNIKGGAFFTLNYKNKNIEDINLDDLYHFEQKTHGLEFPPEKDSFYLSSIKSTNSLTFKMFKGLKFENDDYLLSNFEVIYNNGDFNYREGVDLEGLNIDNFIEVEYCILSNKPFNILLVSILNQAVLTFYFNNGERVSEDRLRLLLLLRTDIRLFIEERYKTDSLISYIEEEKNKTQFGEVGHLESNIEEVLLNYQADEKLKIKIFFKDFLLYKNKLQQLLIAKNNEPSFYVFLCSKFTDEYIDVAKVKDNLELLIKFFFKEHIDIESITTDIKIDEINELLFFPEILVEILTETIYNIKRYSKTLRTLKSEKEKLTIKISFEDECLTICNNNIREKKDIKRINLNIQHSNTHGLNMLNNLINRLTASPIIASYEEINNEEFFKLKIPLKC